MTSPEPSRVGAPRASGPAADVRPEAWVATVTDALATGFDYFDWLSVVDSDDGALTVVLHLWSRTTREHAFLRTTTADGRVPSVATLLPGAGWHEREAAEMFGLTFEGSPDPRPLLLPDGFDGHPLRKDFPLASRGLVDWPGTHEPTEHGPAARPPGRRRPIAAGVPDWPRAEDATDPQEHSDG